MGCSVLVADQHEVCRAGLRSVLQSLNGVSVCSESADGSDALQQVKQLNPDILIVNLKLPKANGLTIARRLLKTRVKVLIIVDDVSMNTIRVLLEAGVHGIVSKADPASDFVDSVEALRHNRRYYPRSVERAILEGYLHPRPHSENIAGLTLREQEVLQLLAEGGSTKDIAITLGLSAKTVETHRHRMMGKLKLHNIVELVLYAVSHDIVDAPVLPPIVPVEIPTARKPLSRHRQLRKVLPALSHRIGAAMQAGT